VPWDYFCEDALSHVPYFDRIVFAVIEETLYCVCLVTSEVLGILCYDWF
jgi:hypothetical protein